MSQTGLALGVFMVRSKWWKGEVPIRHQQDLILEWGLIET